MKPRALVWMLFGFLLFGFRAGAATAAGDGKLFGLTNLWTIHLTVTPQAWKEMGARAAGRGQGGQNRGGGGGLFESLFGNNSRPPGMGADSGSDRYPWATCTFESDGQVLTNVGVRFKGNSSFVRAPNGWKRPFRLDFNRGVPGRTFLGMEELVLNNNVNDATQMREALAYDLFRKAGIPAPRTAFAKVVLTITGQVERQNLGLYTLVEAVNRDFLKRNFGASTGLLLKPEMMPGLVYFGEDWAGYVDRYGPKGKVDPADARRMMDFARFIQEAEPVAFANQLPKFLETQPFLRFVALNALLANVDSFLGNGHNYYLFIDSKSQHAHFIPWDLNESFGMHPVSGPSSDQMTFSILRPNADPNRLVERILADSKLGPEYRVVCAAMLTNLFEPKRLHLEIDRIAAVTRSVVESESRRAKADFQRTVLGTLAPDSGDVSQPRHDIEIGRDGYRPWGFPDAVYVDNMPLKVWISGRHANVKGQLEGQVRGRRPRARLSQ